MKTKKLIGLALAAFGGYMLWKKHQVMKVALTGAAASVTAPLTAAETEQFSPLVFKTGPGCPR